MKKTMQTEKFKIGQAVKWRSTANGSTTTKKGTIVAAVPAGKEPKKPREAREALAVFTPKPRKIRSYLVLSGNRLYRPRTQHLKSN